MSFNARVCYRSLWSKTTIFKNSQCPEYLATLIGLFKDHMEESLEDDLLLAYKQILMTGGQFFVTKYHNFFVTKGHKF